MPHPGRRETSRRRRRLGGAAGRAAVPAGLGATAQVADTARGEEKRARELRARGAGSAGTTGPDVSTPSVASPPGRARVAGIARVAPGCRPDRRSARRRSADARPWGRGRACPASRTRGRGGCPPPPASSRGRRPGASGSPPCSTGSGRSASTRPSPYQSSTIFSAHESDFAALAAGAPASAVSVASAMSAATKTMRGREW